MASIAVAATIGKLFGLRAELKWPNDVLIAGKKVCGILAEMDAESQFRVKVLSALAIGVDGSLYAGGSFTTAGGVDANYIARWDGANWSPLGAGTNNQVFALDGRGQRHPTPLPVQKRPDGRYEFQIGATPTAWYELAR